MGLWHFHPSVVMGREKNFSGIQLRVLGDLLCSTDFLGMKSVKQEKKFSQKLYKSIILSDSGAITVCRNALHNPIKVGVGVVEVTERYMH